MTRPFIICVDATVHLVADKWKQLLYEYCESEIVDNPRDALALAVRYPVAAMILGSRASAAKVLMHLSHLTAATPVVLLAPPPGSRGSQEDSFEFAIECVDDMESLMAFLQRRLASPTPYTFGISLYRLAPLHWPFGVLVDRAGEIVRYQGETVTMGSGGMFGRLSDVLIPGECVLVDFPQFPEAPLYRASVRSRCDHVYGLVFEQSRKMPQFSAAVNHFPVAVGTG